MTTRCSIDFQDGVFVRRVLAEDGGHGAVEPRQPRQLVARRVLVVGQHVGEEGVHEGHRVVVCFGQVSLPRQPHQPARRHTRTVSHDARVGGGGGCERELTG